MYIIMNLHYEINFVLALNLIQYPTRQDRLYDPCVQVKILCIIGAQAFEQSLGISHILIHDRINAKMPMRSISFDQFH